MNLTTYDPNQAPAVPVSLEEIQAFEIKTILDAEKASRWRSTLKEYEKSVLSWFKPHKQRLDEAHRAMCDDEKKVLAPVKEIVYKIDDKLFSFTAEQEAIRKEEQRKREEEAKKKAEDEQIAAAAEAEKAGDKAVAQAIMETPVAVATPVVPKPKISGATVTMKYGAEVTSLMALVKAVAEGKAPIGCLEASSTFLNAMARIQKETFNYPGVRLVVSQTVRSY